MKGSILENKYTRPSYKEDNLDYDMAFSKSLREKVFWDIYTKRFNLSMLNFLGSIYVY